MTEGEWPWHLGDSRRTGMGLPSKRTAGSGAARRFGMDMPLDCTPRTEVLPLPAGMVAVPGSMAQRTVYTVDTVQAAVMEEELQHATPE